MSGKTPSVSAILLCHDSERYVSESLAGALAQDYRGPLEILVSDDASTDQTFERVERLASSYSGPHTIRLFRRDANTGSKSGHLNHVLPEASGEIIVSFDDDDVSSPTRVRKIVGAFAAPNVQAVFSSFSLIDEDGAPGGPGRVPHPPVGTDAAAWFARVDAFAAGTTLALRHTVVEAFGPLDPEIHEDIVLPFRASLLGNVVFVPEPLVRVRRRADSLTADPSRFDSLDRYRERMSWGIERARRHLASRLADLDSAGSLAPARSAEFGRLAAIATASVAVAESTAGLVSPSFPERVRALLRLIRMGAYQDELPQHAFLALLPETYLRYKRRSLKTMSADGQGSEPRP